MWKTVPSEVREPWFMAGDKIQTCGEGERQAEVLAGLKGRKTALT